MDNIQAIKNKAFLNVIDSMMPEEGETFTVKGGLWNQTLDQRKKENGTYYKRNNEKEEWIEFDANEEVFNLIGGINVEKKSFGR